MNKLKRLKGSLMLLLAALFWGTTFAAQSSAADNIPTFTFTAARSFVGAAFLGLLILAGQWKKGRKPTDNMESGSRAENGETVCASQKEKNVASCTGREEKTEASCTGREEKNVASCIGREEKTEASCTGRKEKTGAVCAGGAGTKKKGAVFGGSICGIVLFAAMNFQQGGIAAYPEGAAASGRSGFLTATYVVMVAVFARFLGRKLQKSVYAAVAVCLVGMYLLCMSGGVGSIYFGDVLGLICAMFFTAHIMVVDHFSYCESVKLSCMQFVVSGILSTVAMLLFEQPNLHMLVLAAGPILYAGILSSGIAYTLQMEGQKYAEPSVAAVIMSLESVFAVLGGWLLLDEKLSGRELLGCGLVFAAVILAQLPQIKRNPSGSGVVS